MKKILCMFSGGLDSVGVLYRLLTSPEYNDFVIHAHHMNIVNKENRAKAEMMACNAMLPFFKDIGDFQLTSSTHEFRFMNRSFIWDMDLCAFMAGSIVMTDLSIRHIAMGRTKTDVDGGGVKFQKRMERAQKVFNSVLSLHNHNAEYIFPVVDYTKQQIWDMLPPEIRYNAWSCRRPRYENDTAIPCEKCPTCKEMESIKRT